MCLDARGAGVEPVGEGGGRGLPGRPSCCVNRCQRVGHPTFLVSGRAIELTPRDVLEQRHGRLRQDERTFPCWYRSAGGDPCLGQLHGNRASRGEVGETVLSDFLGDIDAAAVLDSPGAGVHPASKRCHRRVLERPVSGQEIGEPRHGHDSAM